MHVWRDRLGRWLTPLARASPLSPNTISLLALVINLVAATALYFGAGRPVLFLVAVGLFAIGGLADALDGVVARLQQKSSRFGDFLDHVADRVSDTAIVAGWMLGSGVRAGLAVAGVFVVMLNGYMGTQIEATWGERRYEGVGRGEFVLALIVFPIVSFILADNGWSDLRFATLTVAEWLTVLLVLAALLGIIQRLTLAARLERPR